MTQLEQIVLAVESGLTASDLAAASARIDKSEERIHALVDEPGRWDRIAAELESAPDGPLHGVLVGVKDIFHVDGLPTTAGSTLPPEELAGAEAAAVSLLRSAGAVVLGKTVSTEFAYFEPGPTRNPRDPSRTPGGSSSGSAAAVAAGYCPIALGSQTIGSIIRPAAFCEIVGFKPTYGRISTQGVIPVAESFDTVGLLASDVSWASRGAQILCASWAEKSSRRPIFGVPDGPLLEETGFRESFEELLPTLGCEIVRSPMLEDLRVIEKRHHRLLAHEMARTHREWFARYEDRYRKATASTIRVGQSVAPDEAALWRKDRLRVRQEISATAADAWICPATTGPPPEGLDWTGSPVMNLPWTYAGLPVVTIPVGRFGLQIIGRWMQDEQLLVWASDLEAQFRREA